MKNTFKPIDYYTYWDKKNKGQKTILDREWVSLKLIEGLIKKGQLFLDLGCGQGIFLSKVKEIDDFVTLKGLDFSPVSVKHAKKAGLDVIQGNLEEELPYKANSIDFIYAGEVVEHLYNPDHFLIEVNRVLKKDGYCLLVTPNLLSWINRLLIVVGIQPLFVEYSTLSPLIGSGFLKKFRSGNKPVGHIRIFTLEALKDLSKVNNFEVVRTKGATFDEGLPKPVLFLDKFFKNFPSLSSNLILLLRKK